MTITLEELARLVGGEVRGDGKTEIVDARALIDAGPGEISMLDGAGREKALEKASPSAVVAPKGHAPDGLPAIEVDDVHQAFATIIRNFHPPRKKQKIGVSPAATISPTAKLGADVEIHPGAMIGDDAEIGARTTIHSGARVMAGVKIGEDATIFPNVTLYENVVVGPRCILHAGAVVGANGFGYRMIEGRHVLAAQLGNVRIGADVEVGANSTIDRGAYGPTVIGEGTKIDNQVMIAHNCRIGRHNLICSQVGVAGSTTTGDYVVMAGQVGVRDHVHIGDRAVLGAMAGVINDVPAGAVFIGIPATPEREQKLKQAAFSKLPEMRRQLKTIQRQLDRSADEAASSDSSVASSKRPNAA